MLILIKGIFITLFCVLAVVSLISTFGNADVIPGVRNEKNKKTNSSPN